MSLSINGKISVEVLFNEIISSGNQGKGFNTKRFSFLVDLLTGTSDNMVNKGYAATITGVGASVTTVYDMIGVLLDGENVAQNFDEVVLIGVRNRSLTPANYLLVGPDATAGFGVVASNVGFWADASDRNVLPADGDSWLLLHCKGGVPAVNGSTDELAIITQAGTSLNTWDIMILGRDNP